MSVIKNINELRLGVPSSSSITMCVCGRVVRACAVFWYTAYWEFVLHLSYVLAGSLVVTLQI
jgi:hypothetical protein